LSRSGVKLRLIHLNDDDKREMVDKMLLRVHRYPDSVNDVTTKKGENHLLNFYNWLDHREGRPFTALIDGANVAYFHQNNEDGKFSFHQIKFMVDFLERLGENPLVILPSKYGYSNFNISVGAPGYYPGKKQFFTQEEINIRENLSQFGKIFFVPAGMLGKKMNEIKCLTCSYFVQ
jgi:Zc3h12a-like Ribonuclease NYN domain